MYQFIDLNDPNSQSTYSSSARDLNQKGNYKIYYYYSKYHFLFSLFVGRSFSKRLDASDALFVDVIHTDAARMGYGTTDQSGHKDFYPNGGGRQNGCRSNVCDHTRSIKYYVESIRSKSNRSRKCEFTGSVCNSWRSYKTRKCVRNAKEVMGIDAVAPSNLATKLKIYLSTNSRSPYCLNDRASGWFGWFKG